FRALYGFTLPAETSTWFFHGLSSPAGPPVRAGTLLIVPPWARGNWALSVTSVIWKRIGSDARAVQEKKRKHRDQQRHHDHRGGNPRRQGAPGDRGPQRRP